LQSYKMATDNRYSTLATAKRFFIPIFILAALIYSSVEFLDLDTTWSIPLALTLFAFTIVADYSAISLPTVGKLSGSILVLVVAAVILGPLPAMALGSASILVSWLRWRIPYRDLVVDALTYAIFPLAAGVFFQVITTEQNLTPSGFGFYVIVFYSFLFALVINFVMIAADTSYVKSEPFLEKVRTAFLPLLPTECLAGLLSAGIVYVYYQVGPAALSLVVVVLIVIQYLIGALMTSQQRAEALQKRTKQLATFQVGLLGAMVRTLDLRDQMTARHSAAVARYSRAIALASGLPEEEADLAHTAGLLHDIGKFILPDRILKSTGAPLSEEDWQLIRQHPEQGANVVSAIEGYGPVAEIVLSHHERVDGKGYPRGLKGDEIPFIARIIAVADTYDVLTARDSYRDPISPEGALEILQQVAGTQLELELVETFERLLNEKAISFRHGESADFDAELAIDRRSLGLVEEIN